MIWFNHFLINNFLDIFLPYTTTYAPLERVDELLSWFEKFSPDFSCIYFDEPDSTGHKFGPYSKEYMAKVTTSNVIYWPMSLFKYKHVKIGEMDSILGYLLDGLNRLKMENKINILIVSDHGITTMSKDQFVFVQNYVNMSLIDDLKTIYSVCSNVYVKSDEYVWFNWKFWCFYENENNNIIIKLNEVYESMQKIPNIKVYLRKNVPEEYNYRLSDRIGLILK